MARIAGVDLPRNKRTNIALTYIYGIGHLARGAHTGRRPRSKPMKKVQDLGRRRGQPHPPGHRERKARSKAICAKTSR